MESKTGISLLIEQDIPKWAQDSVSSTFDRMASRSPSTAIVYLRALKLLPKLPVDMHTSTPYASRKWNRRRILAIIKNEVDGKTVRHHMRVGGTPIWFSLKEIKDVRAAVFLGLVANTVTQNAYVGVSTTAAAALWKSVKSLSDAELEILAIMQRAGDGDIYQHWIATADILANTPEDEGTDHVLDLLANMTKRGILREVDGRWQAIK